MPSKDYQDYLDYQEYLASQGGPTEESVVPEAHPDITWGTRALIKNFGVNPEQGVQYIKQNYPGMEAKVKDGEIVVKKPGESAYRYIDKPGFDLQDITDVGYDVGAGALEGTAAAGAGLAAAPLGGIGAIPAAMAAGGASASGLELLRQKLGQKMGLPQADTSWKDVAIAGGTGAVSPLLFGTGAAAGKIAAKAASKGVAEDALKQTQKGLISRGYNAATREVIPGTFSMFGGYPKVDINTLQNNWGELKSMSEDVGVLENVLERGRKNLINPLGDLLKQYGEDIDTAMRSAGSHIDISKAKQALKDRIAQFKGLSEEEMTPAIQEILSNAEDTYKSIFTKQGENGAFYEIPDLVSIDAAKLLKERLMSESGLRKMPAMKTVMGPKGASLTQTPSDLQLSAAAGNAWQAINDSFDLATEDLTKRERGKYKDLIDTQKFLKRYFDTPEKAYSTLINLEKPNKKMVLDRLENLAKAHGISAHEEAKLLSAFALFHRPSLGTLGGGQTTSTSKTLAAGSLAAAAGNLAASSVGVPPKLMPFISALSFGAGSSGASPWAAKKFVGAHLGAEKYIGKAGEFGRKIPVAGKVFNRNAWQRGAAMLPKMKSDKEQE